VPKITELYAFVSIGSDPDDEGIIAFQTNDGTWVPMVGADMTRVNELTPIANQICKTVARQYKILRFKLENEIEKKQKKNLAKTGEAMARFF
jgi:hypothetical protein